MNKKQINNLAKQFKLDAAELEKQEFNNVCTTKKLDIKTGELIPYALSINYWEGIIQMPINLIREEAGNYSLTLNKQLIKSNVPITEVRKTLESYKFDVQVGMLGNVISFTFRKRRGKSNVQKNKTNHSKIKRQPRNNKTQM